LASTARKTLVAAAMTSTPMPSLGSTAMLTTVLTTVLAAAFWGMFILKVISLVLDSVGTLHCAAPFRRGLEHLGNKVAKARVFTERKIIDV
jgi:hypothetical protein